MKRHDGYLLIDHRNSPGVSRAFGGAACVTAGADQVFEAATSTCSHCQSVVVLNPDRTRERGYCRGCDHYICDACVARGVCSPFAKLMDVALDRAARGETMEGLIDGKA